MTTISADRTIGLILANASSSFTTAFMDLFEQQLYRKKYQLVIGLTNHNIDLERFYLDYFGKNTKGIIILSDASDYGELADAVPDTIPTVFIHRAPANCERTAIIENDYSATYQAILNLVHSGHPNVALLCRNIKFSTSREIIQAYRDAMQTTDVGFHENWIFEYNLRGDTEANLVNVASQIMEHGCTGILAASIEITEHLLSFLYDYNESHKQLISLTGFSTEDRNRVVSDSLDTISRPIHRTVDLALQQIFYLMEHPDAQRSEYIVKGIFQSRVNDIFQAR